MTEGKKALEFKHAHITGQAMRDHWGPIVERIAAETADWRDAWIHDLITENERLRQQLSTIGPHMKVDPSAIYPQSGGASACAALGEKQ